MLIKFWFGNPKRNGKLRDADKYGKIVLNKKLRERGRQNRNCIRLIRDRA
jgi:hypothetical protein